MRDTASLGSVTFSVDKATGQVTGFVNEAGDPYFCDSMQTVEIPDTFHGQKIVSIGDSAFSGLRAKSCQEIEKIIIPEGVKRIDREAFRSCKKLKEIILLSHY